MARRRRREPPPADGGLFAPAMLVKPDPEVRATLNFDGGCSPNPGPARSGYVLRIGDRAHRGSREIGVATCNTAEYQALIDGLEQALAKGVTHLQVYGDSQLVVNGVNGGPRRTGKPHLEALKAVAIELVGRFRKCDLGWVPRERNEEADRLTR